jgi:hypothetical protein
VLHKAAAGESRIVVAPRPFEEDAMGAFVDLAIPRHLTFSETTHSQFRIECEKHDGVTRLE